MHGKKEFGKKELIQEEEYLFPYHYIPRLEKGVFSQFMNLNWGFEYLSAMEYLLNLLEKQRFESLVDAGCGDGRFCSEASRRFPGKRILGIDVSSRAVSIAGALNPGLEFISCDITDTASASTKSLEGSFDMAVSVEVLEHIKPEECEKFLLHVSKLIKRGGRLLLTVPTVNTPLQEKHYRHFTLELLKGLVEPYFEIESVFYLNKISWSANLLRKLMTNRVFIINSPLLRKWFYRRYCRKNLAAESGNGKRIVILSIKK